MKGRQVRKFASSVPDKSSQALSCTQKRLPQGTQIPQLEPPARRLATKTFLLVPNHLLTRERTGGLEGGDGRESFFFNLKHSRKTCFANRKQAFVRYSGLQVKKIEGTDASTSGWSRIKLERCRDHPNT
jgi:hypothetical protein